MSGRTTERPRYDAEPGGCDVPLVRAHDVLLLDLDGVVYLGRDPVPGAADAIVAARAAGARVAFVTNNASRRPDSVADQLTDLGIPAGPDDVVTAAQAAARMVADRVPSGAPVLLVGGEGLRAALHEYGLRPVTAADANPVAVVQGYAPDLGYWQLAEGVVALRAGALFVATNLDRTMPSPRGPLPGNGALVEVLRYATGIEPVSAGKPEPALLQEAVRRTGARASLVVGDRLETDIEGGTRSGLNTLLVLTGVTDASALLRAPAERRPTYVGRDLSALLRPQAAVERSVEGWSCGGWTASLDADSLRLAGSGTYEDGLRALCAAAWSVHGDLAVDTALERLSSAR